MRITFNQILLKCKRRQAPSRVLIDYLVINSNLFFTLESSSQFENAKLQTWNTLQSSQTVYTIFKHFVRNVNNICISRFSSDRSSCRRKYQAIFYAQHQNFSVSGKIFCFFAQLDFLKDDGSLFVKNVQQNVRQKWNEFLFLCFPRKEKLFIK